MRGASAAFADGVPRYGASSHRGHGAFSRLGANQSSNVTPSSAAPGSWCVLPLGPRSSFDAFSARGGVSCGPCRMIAPRLFRTCDISRSRDLCLGISIASIGRCARVRFAIEYLKPLRRRSSHHKHSQRAGVAEIPAGTLVGKWIAEGKGKGMRRLSAAG